MRSRLANVAGAIVIALLFDGSSASGSGDAGVRTAPARTAAKPASKRAAPDLPATTPVAPRTADGRSQPSGGEDPSAAQSSNSGGSGLLCAALLIAGVGLFVWSRLRSPAKKEMHEGSTPSFSSGPRDARWILPGEIVEVGGRRIPGGQLYFGTSFKALALSADEPSLVNPLLKVRGPPNILGSGMPYWPSYSLISPDSRAAFLDWMATGRSDPRFGVGYVFIFFYGLERRALTEATRSPVELRAIRGEVLRLAGIYGRSKSFRGYSGRFVAALNQLLGEDTQQRDADMGSLLTVLGKHAADRRPVAPDLALSVALADDSLRRKPAVLRCRDQFDALFRTRYEKSFGDGLVPMALQAPAVQPTYQPASASFGGPVRLPVPVVPRVAKASVQQIIAVGEECADALAGYSRYVARATAEDDEALTRVALLPRELRSEWSSDTGLDELRAFLDRELAARETVALDAKVVLSPFKVKADEKLPKALAVSLASALEALGFGFEPDPRFGAAPPMVESKLVVFRIADGAPSAPSTQYSSGLSLLHLSCTVAAADGVISSHEEQLLRQQIEDSLELEPDERLRMRAHLQWLKLYPPKATGLSARLEKLPKKGREDVAHFLISVATSDGTVDGAERKLLERVVSTLKVEVPLPAAALKSARIKGPSTQGYTIPPPHSPSPPPAPTPSLDMNVVSRRLKETAEVAALLGSVFQEEENELPKTAASPDPSASEPGLRGMDARHSAFARQLLSTSTWTRDDIERLAGSSGLMLDGALETLNEAAFESVGAAVVEGEDPIIVDEEVAKEFLNV